MRTLQKKTICVLIVAASCLAPFASFAANVKMIDQKNIFRPESAPEQTLPDTCDRIIIFGSPGQGDIFLTGAALDAFASDPIFIGHGAAGNFYFDALDGRRYISSTPTLDTLYANLAFRAKTGMIRARVLDPAHANTLGGRNLFDKNAVIIAYGFPKDRYDTAGNLRFEVELADYFTGMSGIQQKRGPQGKNYYYWMYGFDPTLSALSAAAYSKKSRQSVNWVLEQTTYTIPVSTVSYQRNALNFWENSNGAIIGGVMPEMGLGGGQGLVFDLPRGNLADDGGNVYVPAGSRAEQAALRITAPVGGYKGGFAAASFDPNRIFYTTCGPVSNGFREIFPYTAFSKNGATGPGQIATTGKPVLDLTKS